MVAPGTPVSTAPAPFPSKNIRLLGKHVTIVGVSPTHVEAMFAQIGGEAHTKLYEHLFSGPYLSAAEYTSVVEKQAADESTIFYTILLNDGSAQGKPVGHYSLMRIDALNRVCEVGHVLFAPALQRTPAATEAIYLVAKHVFEDLGYRRFEWKCNSLNEPSKRAAARLGFTYEGCFRQHMIQRGRSRDTAWFAMLDGEWDICKKAFEMWLKPSNFDEEGKQRKRLEEFREG